VVSVSDWADRYRVLSKGSSSEAGRWNTARTPYLREIMDCLSADHPAQEVVFMKATQIGGTECGNNWIGSIIHQGLGPTMMVLPTSNAAKKASKTRISPMISDTPVLTDRVRDARSRDSGNTMLLKEFDGGVLIFAGANSSTELKSSPVGNLFLDETEEYPPDVDGQGDPEVLATKRSDTFARKKIFKVSTPTVKGGRIDRAYRASDQRHYYLPCPHCQHEQQLRFERLRWDMRTRWEFTDSDGIITEVDAETPGAIAVTTDELLDVWYECEACDKKIFEHYKTRMLAAGTWKAQNPGPDRAVGFALSALYSPMGWFSWRKIVLAHLDAKKDTSGSLGRTFNNTVLGEPYEPNPGETIDENWLKRRIETDWRIGEIVPAGALLLCAGVDVQHNRLHVGIWGYGRDIETWLIDRHILYGPPQTDEPWSALEKLLEREWKHQLGGNLKIAQMAIDASDGNTTHFVRAFVRKWTSSRRVIAVKGQAVQGKPLIGKPTLQDVNWRGKLIPGGVKLWPMGSDTGKAAFYRRLQIETPGPGYVHLPSGLPDEVFAQLTAETLATRYVRGHPIHEWHLPRGKANEDLDCRIMSDAAAERYGVRSAPWARFENELRINAGESPPAAKPEEPPVIQSKPRPPAQGWNQRANRFSITRW
jgi:phage terminase large subunit GpA-like protein